MCLHGPIIKFQRLQAWLALWTMCDGRKLVGKETQEPDANCEPQGVQDADYSSV